MALNCTFNKLWSTITSPFNRTLKIIFIQKFLILFIFILSCIFSTAYIRELNLFWYSLFSTSISLQSMHFIVTFTHLYFTPTYPSTLHRFNHTLFESTFDFQDGFIHKSLHVGHVFQIIEPGLRRFRGSQLCPDRWRGEEDWIFWVFLRIRIYKPSLFFCCAITV